MKRKFTYDGQYEIREAIVVNLPEFEVALHTGQTRTHCGCGLCRIGHNPGRQRKLTRNDKFKQNGYFRGLLNTWIRFRLSHSGSIWVNTRGSALTSISPSAPRMTAYFSPRVSGFGEMSGSMYTFLANALGFSTRFDVRLITPLERPHKDCHFISD